MKFQCSWFEPTYYVFGYESDIVSCLDTYSNIWKSIVNFIILDFNDSCEKPSLHLQKFSFEVNIINYWPQYHARRCIEIISYSMYQKSFLCPVKVNVWSKFCQWMLKTTIRVPTKDAASIQKYFFRPAQRCIWPKFISLYKIKMHKNSTKCTYFWWFFSCGYYSRATSIGVGTVNLIP